MSGVRRYCLDSNVFIEGWNKYYSYDLCPGYWGELDRLGQEGIVFSPTEVKREILQNDDGLSEWIVARPYLFWDVTEDVQERLREILRTHPRLVDSTRQRSTADPWVIAYALAHEAIVVTKEFPAGQQSRRIKIPDVCNDLGVPWIDDFRLAREMGLMFEIRRRA